MKQIIDTIGDTPLVKLKYVSKELGANVYGKCEFFNPAGSVKDRVALYLIQESLKQDPKIKSFIEPTSGNTGIGLAFVASFLGLDLTVVMPESMSFERRATIKHFGAKLVLTPAREGMSGSIKKAYELSKKSGAQILNQFENSANIKAHFETTAPEIYSSCQDIDIFITGVGTGGTISGVGRYLKSKDKSIKVYAVEPQESAVISGKSAGPHKIEGIGAGFIPKNLDLDILDDVVTVSSQSAIKRAKELSKKEALFVGISSGANIEAIYNLSKKVDIRGKNIVTILPDSASRYLSTELFK